MSHTKECVCCNPEAHEEQKNMPVPDGYYRDEDGYMWKDGEAFSGFVWCSFADETGFLGVIITEAKDVIEATKKAWDAEINPGGEVMALPLSDQYVEKVGDVFHESIDRLLDSDEADNIVELASR